MVCKRVRWGALRGKAVGVIGRSESGRRADIASRKGVVAAPLRALQGARKVNEEGEVSAIDALGRGAGKGVKRAHRRARKVRCKEH